MSSRADLISPGVAAELSKLQSRVPPFSDADAFQMIEQELGRPIAEVFATLQPQAAASASLAQVRFLPPVHLYPNPTAPPIPLYPKSPVAKTGSCKISEAWLVYSATRL